MATDYRDLAVKEDLDLGTSTAQVRNPGGGTLTGTQINLATFAVGAVSASATWDTGSIGVGSKASKEITVTGAALGDYVVRSLDVDAQDLTLTADVTAANLVTAVLSNNGSAAVDLGSPTIKVLVFRTS